MIRKFTIYATFLSGLIMSAANPVLAQTAPATPAQTAKAEPTASQIALGREIIIGSGISRSFALLVPQYLDQIGMRLTQTRPDLIKDLNVVMDQLKPEFDKRVSVLIDQSGLMYARIMSEDEMKQIVNFYKSPAGVKYVDAQPLVMDEMYRAVQTLSQQLSVDMMTRVREEMKKKGHEL